MWYNTCSIIRGCPVVSSNLPSGVLLISFLLISKHWKTRPYTRQHQSRAGGQGQYGSWAGAVTEICSPLSSKRPKTRSDYGRTDGPTDRRTDRPTDRPTDIVTYGVACTRLKRAKDALSDREYSRISLKE